LFDCSSFASASVSDIGELSLAEFSLAGGYSALCFSIISVFLILGHGAINTLIRLHNSLQPCGILVQNEIIDALIVLKSGVPVLLLVRRHWLGLKLLRSLRKTDRLAMQERRRERRLKWASPQTLRKLIYPFFAAIFAQDYFRLSFDARVDFHSQNFTSQRRWLGEGRREESR